MLLWVAARRSHAYVARHPAFVVDPAAAVAHSPAPWLDRDDLESIREDSGLLGRRFSFFTPGLDRIFEEAYESSPWVRRVTGVRLVYPNRVYVALEVRRPVCAVPWRSRGLLLVDENGVRLPGVRSRPPPGLSKPFPRLLGVTGRPVAPGEVWSGQVCEGAAVALDLTGMPEALKRAVPIAAIDVGNVGGRKDRVESEIVLVTDSGVRIEWGRSRRSPLGDLDPPVTDKFLRLEQALRAYPGLRGVGTVKLQYDALYTIPAAPGAQ
jgi:cell division septal protein FtsQ